MLFDQCSFLRTSPEAPFRGKVRGGDTLMPPPKDATEPSAEGLGIGTLTIGVDGLAVVVLGQASRVVESDNGNTIQ